MANLEFANLFLPASSVSGLALAAGTVAVTAVDPTMTRTPSFSQLFQAGATRELTTGVVIAGLAGMPAVLNLATVTPTEPGAPSLDPSTTAALLAESLMPGAATGETSDSKDSGADAEPVDLVDPADDTVMAVVQWPGLPLFMEARAALSNDSATGSQPEKAVSVAGIESARWSFMLRSAGVGASQFAGDEHAPASLTPATPGISTSEISSPEISATDAAELAVITEFELPPAQTQSISAAESPQPVSFNAPLPANSVASPATPAKPDSIEAKPANLVASLATPAKFDLIEAKPVNPVAAPATPAKPDSIEAKPVNPVASPATPAKPDPIEAKPVNPVAAPATSGQSIETAAADPAAMIPQRLPSADEQPFSRHPLVAAPFAQADSAIASEATPRNAEAIAPTPGGSALPVPQSPITAVRPDQTAASTTLPVTPEVIDLNQKNWGRTLGHQLNWMVNNQLQEAAIRINPPDLGPIELRVSLQHNQTSVTFFCHESAVREALESALPRLREMLDSQGISLNQAQVSDQSLARQQAGSGGQPSFSQRDDRPPATPIRQETSANETEPRSPARQVPGTVDDYV